MQDLKLYQERKVVFAPCFANSGLRRKKIIEGVPLWLNEDWEGSILW